MKKKTIRQRLLTPYFTEGSGKIVSHITRVNYIGNSSKIIFPKGILSWMDLNWDDDYIEWKEESRNGERIAIIKRFSALSDRNRVR